MSGVQQVLLGVGGGKSITYIGNTSSTADDTVYTFTNHAIGVASADRRVHVLIAGDGEDLSGVIDSVTVGGVSATINVQDRDDNISPSAAIIGGIVTAHVPTGTTGTIVVTFSATQLRCNVGVYASRGLTSNNDVDTDTSTSDPGADTLTSLAGGFLLGLACNNSSTSVTWTNATEDYDTQIESTATASGASIRTSGTSVSPSANYASSGTVRVAAFATF